MSSRGARFPPWLLEALDSERFSNMEWLDRNTGKFRVLWKHKNSKDFDMKLDGSPVIVRSLVSLDIIYLANVHLQ